MCLVQSEMLNCQLNDILSVYFLGLEYILLQRQSISSESSDFSSSLAEDLNLKTSIWLSVQHMN